jgi:hypothetical protein
VASPVSAIRSNEFLEGSNAEQCDKNYHG